MDPKLPASDAPSGASALPGSPAGSCDHTQPSEVARLGEEFLRSQGVPEADWDGCRFGYGGDGGSGPFKAVYTEVERRGPNWVAVKLDRLKTELPPERLGFRVVRLSEGAANKGS